MRRAGTSVLMAAVMLLTSGCGSWEKATYAALASAKAVIDQAGLDYNAGKIQRSDAAQQAILRAQQAQTVAVNAFAAYATAKVAHASAGEISLKTKLLQDAVAALPGILAALQALGSSPHARLIPAVAKCDARDIECGAAAIRVSALELRVADLGY